jgi:hypothetical protein
LTASGATEGADLAVKRAATAEANENLADRGLKTSGRCENGSDKDEEDEEATLADAGSADEAIGNATDAGAETEVCAEFCSTS